MRLPILITAFGSLLSSTLGASDSNLTTPLTSRQILPSNFQPPQVFRNINLLRNTNLEKAYVRETVNVVVENVDSKPQDEYYLPFEADEVEKLGGMEVRDKKDPGKGSFHVEIVEYDTYRSGSRSRQGWNNPSWHRPHSPTEFYRITFPTPLPPSSQITLSITYHLLSTLTPLPASIAQNDKQYLLHHFSAYHPSAYPTLKQKTKLKLPTVDIPEYTILPPTANADGKEDPQRQGSTFTYGPYGPVPAGAHEPATVRYEFTKPILRASLLQCDVEVSQWGGNLATEERYWLANDAAGLANHFSRVAYAQTAYYNPPTVALRALNVPLPVGSLNPYFTDDIGNVSTSRFCSNAREANLEIRPRYPVFGGWKYSFRIGWDADLMAFLRKRDVGGVRGYVLKVPFLEGPKMPEGVGYERVEVRVLLPEGATYVSF
jgi:oligosaccharyltransferase complex subunit alpha (ribophorin I)